MNAIGLVIILSSSLIKQAEVFVEACLVGRVVSSTAERWANGDAQRKQFLTYLTDKGARATGAEFKLEQVTSIGKRDHEPRALLQRALRSRASE